MTQDKISDKIIEIKEFLSKVKYFYSFKEPDLKMLASKLITKNCYTGEVLCDQNEICHSLYILKNGQISLIRVINKHEVDTSSFAKVLNEKYRELPELIEVEVKIKFNAGDMFLLTEILRGRPSKYKIRVSIPSQVYACTVFDLRRYVGIDKFNRVPDADYFNSSDADLLKYELEKRSWANYKDNLFQSYVAEQKKKEYYTKTNSRGAYQSFSQPVQIEPDMHFYFTSKQKFFHDQPEVVPGLSKKIDKINRQGRSAAKLPFKRKVPAFQLIPSQDSSYDGNYYRPLQDNSIRVKYDRQANLDSHENSYHNDMDDDHITNILKFQCKKIIGAAYTEWLEEKRKQRDIQKKMKAEEREKEKMNSRSPRKIELIPALDSESDMQITTNSKSASIMKQTTTKKISDFKIRSSRHGSMSKPNL